jgi:hypothetical protein
MLAAEGAPRRSEAKECPVAAVPGWPVVKGEKV